MSSRGRFGQVHKCVENSSGLTLAAKVIKARSVKEKVRAPNVQRRDDDLFIIWMLQRELLHMI